MLYIADPAVACAVDTAATLLLITTDREHEQIIETQKAELLAVTLLTGKSPAKPAVNWETVEEW